MPKLVYLSGPIAGLSYKKSISWRVAADKMLREGSDGRVVGLSPMRGKEMLRLKRKITSIHDYADVNCSSRAVTQRDRNDTMNLASLMLVYWGEMYDRPSVGTLIEFGWADAARIPVIQATGPRPRKDSPAGRLLYATVNHLIVNGIAGWTVETLDEAVLIALQILDVGGET